LAFTRGANEARFDKVNGRIDALETKMDGRFDRLERTLDQALLAGPKPRRRERP
jgi:hypothetical protein